MAALLLITHDDLLAIAYRARLSREGFTVKWFRSGDAGLLEGRRLPPDVVLLDLTLPGMNGLEVLKWRTETPQLISVPFILLLERTVSADVLQECLFWRIDSYLHKDLTSLQDVSACIHALLRSAAHAHPARMARVSSEPAVSSS